MIDFYSFSGLSILKVFFQKGIANSNAQFKSSTVQIALNQKNEGL